MTDRALTRALFVAKAWQAPFEGKEKLQKYH